MKNKKIAVLCVSESHSDDKQIEILNKKYSPIYSFYHTHNRENA